MDIELRNDRIPRNPFDRQFLDMCLCVYQYKLIQVYMYTSLPNHSIEMKFTRFLVNCNMYTDFKKKKLLSINALSTSLFYGARMRAFGSCSSNIAISRHWVSQNGDQRRGEFHKLRMYIGPPVLAVSGHFNSVHLVVILLHKLTLLDVKELKIHLELNTFSWIQLSEEPLRAIFDLDEYLTAIRTLFYPVTTASYPATVQMCSV